MDERQKGATLGPWTLSDDPVRRVIKGAGTKPRTVCIVERWTSEPDAQLLAAAPLLADALETLVRDLPHAHLAMCECDYCENLKAAHAALRAAGREANEVSAAQPPPKEP